MREHRPPLQPRGAARVRQRLRDPRLDRSRPPAARDPSRQARRTASRPRPRRRRRRPPRLARGFERLPEQRRHGHEASARRSHAAGPQAPPRSARGWRSCSPRRPSRPRAGRSHTRGGSGRSGRRCRPCRACSARPAAMARTDSASCAYVTVRSVVASISAGLSPSRSAFARTKSVRGTSGTSTSGNGLRIMARPPRSGSGRLYVVTWAPTTGVESLPGRARVTRGLAVVGVVGLVVVLARRLGGVARWAVLGGPVVAARVGARRALLGIALLGFLALTASSLEVRDLFGLAVDLLARPRRARPSPRPCAPPGGPGGGATDRRRDRRRPS